jgi:hypothetical protein
MLIFMKVASAVTTEILKAANTHTNKQVLIAIGNCMKKSAKKCKPQWLFENHFKGTSRLRKLFMTVLAAF